MKILIRAIDKEGFTLRQPTNPCLREADQSLAGTSAQKCFQSMFIEIFVSMFIEIY